MPIFKCHLVLTVADHHTATMEVEADTADAAMNLLSDTEISEMQRQPDYDSADRSDARFIRCSIDGVPCGDNFGAPSPAASQTVGDDDVWDDTNSISIRYHISYVQSIRSDLTDDQAMKVLRKVQFKCDPEDGIDWDVLSFWADDMFPLAMTKTMMNRLTDARATTVCNKQYGGLSAHGD